MVIPLLALVVAALPHDSVRVQVDSAEHTVVITAGPFEAPAMMAMPGHEVMMMDHAMAHDSPLQRFAWPVDGWLRGFRIEVVGADGRPLPRRILHHLIVVNFGRRQLIYPAYERLIGAGAETEDVALPRSVGVPVQQGMPLGLYAGWHNETGEDLSGVSVRLTLLWLPRNQNPRPVDVLPFYADVNLDIGGSNTFDVPPGESRKSYTFSLPLSGRLLGIGGHMHDFGTAVQLEEAQGDRVIARLETRCDSIGRVLGLGRKLYGVSGAGLKLRAGRAYRVVGIYRNPTGETRVHGAMASMVGLFAPDDLARWPALQDSDPSLAHDLAGLGPSE